jgi:TIR domain-containing protein
MTDFVAIVIGAHGDLRRVELEKDLRDRTAGLNESNERLDIIDQSSASSIPAKARAVAALLCRPGTYDPSEIDAIAECRRQGVPIIPVVENLADFTKVAPTGVADFNGFELADIADIGELAGLMLELLGLQRAKRKVFISYARMDSRRIAQQLHEAFTSRWYSVFLDTISIRPGAIFQDELLQELADSDAVVLLNSPNVKDRPYVKQEIAFADRAGVSGIQVVWPGMRAMREGTFFPALNLDDQLAETKDGTVESLTPEGIKQVLRQVANQRTDMQRIREVQLVRPIRAYAGNKGWNVVSYLGRHIELQNGDNKIHLDMALGVPTSFDLERAFLSRTDEKAVGRLVYDQLGITNRQARHLHFLGSRLLLEYLDPRTALKWTII